MLSLGFLAILCTLTGCKGGSSPAAAEVGEPSSVSGKVSIKTGGPLVGAEVTFQPVTDPKERQGARFQGWATTDKDGAFSVRARSASHKPGLVPGKYKVTVGLPEGMASPPGLAAKIPEAYRSISTTPWEVEIHAQDNVLEPRILE